MDNMVTQSDEEEEILVYVEFEDSVDVKHYGNINILGIKENEKAPIAQMDDTFFSGAYEVPLGTYMFFEEDPAPESLDPLFDKLPEKNLKYVGKTRKLIRMEHAYVTTKDNGDQNIKKEVEKTAVQIPNVKFRTVQQAIDQFKTILPVNITKDPDEPANLMHCKKMPKSPKNKKQETLESMFHDLNRNFVKINKQERLKNNVALYIVLEKVLKLMRDSDKLFNSMKPKLAYMGSYFDGLRVGHPTEFDINVVLKIPVNYDKIELDSTHAQYDNTYIKMPSEFRRLYKNPVTAERGFKKTEIWCDRSYRLSVTKFRSWMQSVVDAALMQLPVEGGKHMLKADNECFGIVSKLAGPANNLTIYQGDNIIDIDLVPTFTFKLPKIPKNCKVHFSRPEFKSIKEYFVVPKPSTDDYSWRLSFPFQERLVIQNKNNLKSVVKLLKLLRDIQGFTQLASYFIKTLFLWEAEATSDLFWKRKSISYLVIYMLTKLRDSLALYRISNFWCPDHNLLMKIRQDTCENWSNRLTNILNVIQENKKKCPLMLMEYFKEKQ